MNRRPRVLLGVSGGIAAYKSAEIVRGLVEREAEVRVAMTRAAREFVAPLTFAVLSGHEVYLEVFAGGNVPAVDHVELADWTDLLLIAPATAHTIARLANGLADDFLTTYALVHRGPVLIAPAMETRMWEHPATRTNLELLAARGARFVGPGTGFLASGREGPGRMAEPSEIVEEALSLATSARRDLENLLAAEFAECDVLAMAAAVADFIPESIPERLHREEGEASVRLLPGRDLLAGLAALRGNQTIVAFAAETEDLEDRGRRKMETKGADLVVVNDVGRSDVGFDAAENEVLLIARDGPAEPISRRSKREVADRIWDAVLRIRSSTRRALRSPLAAGS